MDKIKLLQAVDREIECCRLCQINTTGLPVPGEGNPDAKIMFMGEAPGRTESETGRPFVGRSGKYLTSLIESIGLMREDVFITSPVKYYPGMRTPTQKEIEHGMVHTAKQIEIINPSVVVLLGKTAMKGILGEDIKLQQRHGTVIERNGRNFFLTYHPAAAVRFQKNKALIESDFKKLNMVLG